MRGVDAAAAGGITNVLLTLPLPLFPARVRLLLAATLFLPAVLLWWSNAAVAGGATTAGCDGVTIVVVVAAGIDGNISLSR